MTRTRAALFAAMLLPLTGCVFAVGADDEGTEKIRDEVRELERRVDRLERPATVVYMGEKVEPAPVAVPVPVPSKDPK